MEKGTDNSELKLKETILDDHNGEHVDTNIIDYNEENINDSVLDERESNIIKHNNSSMETETENADELVTMNNNNDDEKSVASDLHAKINNGDKISTTDINDDSSASKVDLNACATNEIVYDVETSDSKDNQTLNKKTEIGSTTSIDESFDSEEEEILKNTQFTDADKFPKRPSRSRRSGVVNDSTFVERLLSTDSQDSDLLFTDDNDEEESQTPTDYSIDSNLSNTQNVESDLTETLETNKNNTPEQETIETEVPSSPVDHLTDIYYEEGPKRLKRNKLQKEDFSGAKTFQNKNKLIVTYPNRKVSFEHRLVNDASYGEYKISPLALEITNDSDSVSPRKILKNNKRRVSFESQMYRHIEPTGHINYAYIHDEMTDKLEKRRISMETAQYYEQESEFYKENDFNQDNEESTETGDRRFVINVSDDSDDELFPDKPVHRGQNGFCKRSFSDGNFTEKEHFTEKQLSMVKRPSLTHDGGEFGSLNKHFSAHLRKDSIALTSEKLRQLETIQRHYNPSTYVVEEPVWKQKLSNWKKYQLHICVLCIFVALISIVVVGWHFHNRTNTIESIGKRIFFDAKSREIYLPNPGDTHRLTGMIGFNVPSWQLPFHCHSEEEKLKYTCLRWKDNAVLRISYFEMTNVKCYNISWEQLRNDITPFDCFDIGDDSWYGPGNQSNPAWPLTSEPFVFNAAISRHFDAGTFSSAIDYHWISSGGSAIFVNNNVPLEVDWNMKPGKICLMAKYAGDFYGGHSVDKPRLHYTVCSGTDAVSTYKYTRSLMEKFPKYMPTTSVLQHPVWSFRVDDQTNNNDALSNQILQSISSANLPCSLFEISGQWQQRLGDLSFNNKTLTNMSHIADLVANSNCGLSVEITPYFDVMSSNFREGFTKDYFIKDSGSFSPGFVRWNNEVNAMLDVSKSSASLWMKQKLLALKHNYNIQSFSVVYGNPYWVPYNPSFYLPDVGPSILRVMYSEMFSAATSTLHSDIIHGTSNSQDIPYLLPVSSTIVKVNGQECLSGAIERTLALAIKGYPFIISDLMPIETTKVKTLPSRELYIRWLQLSAFLPAMRYSIMPWDYDPSVIEIAQNTTHLHRTFIAPTIMSLSNEIMAGEPIIRPIWWVFPNDSEAFKISDEFLIGNNILVAPVLCDNVRERRIYFPEGMWSDKSDGHLIQGKSWIKYEVNEYKIPYFVRVKVLTTDNPE